MLPCESAIRLPQLPKGGEKVVEWRLVDPAPAYEGLPVGLSADSQFPVPPDSTATSVFEGHCLRLSKGGTHHNILDLSTCICGC